jgi:hypothetical protein
MPSLSSEPIVKTSFRKPITIILGIALVALLWLAFRPELLFVNKSVDDPFPVTSTPISHGHM